MDAQHNPRLILEAAHTTIEYTHADAEQGAVLCLGKDPENDLIQPAPHVSRQHARIEMHRKDFYLVDNSTNGSFLQTEDEQVQYVHRGRLRLWGAGWISLGEPLHCGDPIHFRETL